MTTIVKSVQTEKCLYCNQTFILRWLTTTQEVQVFCASRRMYEDAKNGIIVHRLECMRKIYAGINGGEKMPILVFCIGCIVVILGVIILTIGLSIRG